MTDVKQRVLDAARSLYAEGGYDALSMRKVAKLAGVSTMASYRHFQSKDHLLHHVQAHAFQLYTRVYTRPLLALDDPWEAVYRNMYAYVRFALDDTPYFRIAFMATDARQQLRGMTDAGSESLDESFEVVSQIFARAVPAEHAQTELLRSWGLVHGYVTLHLAERLMVLPTDFERFVGQEIEVYYAALRARYP